MTLGVSRENAVKTLKISIMATTKVNIEFFRNCKVTELKFFNKYEISDSKTITKEMYLCSTELLRDDRHSNVEAFLLNATNVYDYDRTNSSLNVLFECDRLIEFCKRSDDDYSEDFENNQYFFNMLYYIRRLLDIEDDFEYEFEIDPKFRPAYYIQITHDKPVYQPTVQFYMYNKNNPEAKTLITAKDERDFATEGRSFVAQAEADSCDVDDDNEINMRTQRIRCNCHWYHRRHNCKVFRSNEWRNIDQETGAMPGITYRGITNAVTRATLAFLLSKTMNKRERMIVKRDVCSNPYLVMAVNLPDLAYGPYEDNIVLFQRLYRLREMMGVDDDMGVRELLPSFSAEAGEETEEVVEEAMEKPGVLKRIMNSMSAAFEKVKEWADLTYDVVKTAVGKVVGFFTSSFGFISSIFETIVNKIIDVCSKYVWNNFLGKMVRFGKSMFDWAVVSFSIALPVVFAIGAAGLISERLLNFLVKFLTPKEHVKEIEKYEAQSLEPATAGLGYIFAFLGATLGKFNGVDKKVMKERLQYLMLLVAGGTIAATASRFAFGILPYALQDALIFKFAPAWFQEERRMLTWKEQAEMLFKLSKVTKVVTSKEYYTKLNQCLREGPKLMEKLTMAKNKSYYLALLGKLLTIASFLEQKRSMGAQRPEPFCIHISSPPGFGKSLIANKLVRDVFDVEDDEVYSRVANTEHWNGFHSQKVIIYDEFLVGEEMKEKIGTEFLSLKSSGLFLCPMASMDDIAIGTKGTTASPIGLLTMNNTKYHHVSTLDDKALQRRCNVNIRLRVKKGVPVTNGRPVLTPELIQGGNADWLEYGMLPIIGKNDESENNKIVWMSYDTLLEEIREKKEEHERLAQAITSSYGIVVDDEKTSTELMMTMLKESSEIPTKPQGIFDTLRTFVSQGKSRKIRMSELSDHIVDKKGNNPCDDMTLDDEEKNLPKLLKKQYNLGELITSAIVVGKRHVHFCAKCNVKTGPHQTCNGKFLCPVCKVGIPAYMPRVEGDVDYETASSGGEDFDVEELKKVETMRTSTCEKIATSVCVIDGCKSLSLEGKYVCPSHMLTPFEGKDKGEYWRKYFIMTDFSKNVIGLPLRPSDTYSEEERMSKKKMFAIFAISIVVIVAALAILNLILKMINPKEKEISYEAESARATKTTQPAARRRTITKGRLEMKAQGPNIPLLKITVNGTTMNAIGLCGKFILTFAHSLERHIDHVNAGGKITIDYMGKVHHAAIIPSTIACNIDNDWVIFQVDNKQIPSFSDCVKNFITESEMRQLAGTFDVSVDSNSTKRYGPARMKKNLSYAANLGTRTLEDYCAYRMKTEAGDCGSIVRVATGEFTSRIIGLHVAGTDDKTHVPLGACNIITREELHDAMNTEDRFDADDKDRNFVQQGYDYENDFKDMPNLVEIKEVPANQRVHMSTYTKIHKNSIAAHLPYKSVKSPAILSTNDKRATDDPIMKNIIDTLSTTHKEVEEEPVRDIYETMYQNYNEMPFPAGRRRLTFEEACKGVPGLLCSVRVATSPGWPLVLERTKSGKKDFVWFDECGEFHYDPIFKIRVEALCEKMKKGEEPEHIWLGYMKDELVSPEKIANCRTRTIYASSLIATVAFRMAFGCILIAFNNNWENTPLSIGANQYSYDMQIFYDYLNELFGGQNYIAGDYKSFDKRCHPTFRKYSYELLTDMARTYPTDPITDAEIEFFIKHETESPAQLGATRFWTKSNHMSGCFYTTIVNCLVNEGYFRWAFAKLNPTLIYDEHVRCKFLGDDHIAKASEMCKFDQVSIARVLESLGQEYTSDRKGEEIVPFRRFEEITFLGAHPMKVDGFWCGALKKTTLEETCLWTRDNNATLQDTLKQLLELGSIWDFEYYSIYRTNVQRALNESFQPHILLPAWSELRKIVAKRTAVQGMLFYSF